MGDVGLGPSALSGAQLDTLSWEVWPVLAVLGGVDSGLRAGGLCVHRASGRRAVLLGVLKEGSSLAKLQWEEADLPIRYQGCPIGASLTQLSLSNLIMLSTVSYF